MQNTILITIEIEEFKSILNDAITSSIKENMLNFKKEEKIPRLMKTEEVLAIFDTTSVTLRKWVKEGKFPKPIERKGTRNYYKTKEVLESLKTLNSER